MWLLHDLSKPGSTSPTVTLDRQLLADAYVRNVSVADTDE